MTIRTESRITIARSVGEVWAYICDVGLWPQWAPTVLECWVRGGGPLQPGSRVEQRAKDLWRTHDRSQEVTAVEAPGYVAFGPFQFDLALGELTQKGTRVPLTETEIALLRALATRMGEVLSREALCKSVGGDLNERAIDVQVTRLRRKIEPDPGFPRYLRTVRGQGYRLVDA